MTFFNLDLKYEEGEIGDLTVVVKPHKLTDKNFKCKRKEHLFHQDQGHYSLRVKGTWYCKKREGSLILGAAVGNLT